MLESSTGYFQEPLIGNKASVCNGPSGLSLALVVGLLGPGCFLPLKYLCIISPVYSCPLGEEGSDSHTGLTVPHLGYFLPLACPQATGSLQLTMWSPSVLICTHLSAKSGWKLSVTVSMPSWPHSSSWTSGEDPNSAPLSHLPGGSISFSVLSLGTPERYYLQIYVGALFPLDLKAQVLGRVTFSRVPCALYPRSIQAAPSDLLLFHTSMASL